MRQHLIVPMLAGVLTLMGPSQVTHQASPLTPKQRFALELKTCQEAYAGGKPSKCRLFGKIQFVESFPDVKVEEVTSFPDIKVEMVSSFPSSPGKWQRVDSFPDFKVQVVSSFPDYKIQYVQSFPGCN